MALVNKNFSDIITFTRASTATFFNSAGVLTSAATNAPRFDYNPSTLAAQGLLIEEARTNFFTNASGASLGTIGTGTVSGPDGVNCRTFIPTAGVTSFPNITGPVQTFSLSVGQTVDWALSGWIAAGPVGSITLEPRFVFNVSVNNVSSFIYAELQINTSSWTVRTKVLAAQITEVSAPTITLFKPGLYRVTWVVRFTQDATGRNNITASIQARDTANSGTYTADGVSGLQYTLCQAETGSFPTSTIPTTTTALTRAADVASVNTLNPWFNASAGTLFAEATPNTPTGNAANQSVVSLDDATNNNRIQPFRNASSGLPGAIIAAGGVNQYTPSVAITWNQNATGKIALAYSSGNNMFSFNGTNDTGGTGTIPTVTRMTIGARADGGIIWNGYLRRISYYPRRLSNAELVSITS